MKIRFGHLYAANMNPRVRSKPGKIRPVVVIQSSEVIAAGSPGIVIVPTTSKITDQNPLRVHLPAGVSGNRAASDVLVDQVHTLDRGLFRNELGAVPREQMSRILAGLALLIGQSVDAA
jgi:mRNA-degrading endonuclease toxin of MazEF toxin-antitoxin module